jgi:transketolase
MSIMESARDRFGSVLLELAKTDRNVVALDCDLGRSTRSYRITEIDKDRFFEIGIAEQNMVSTAAGLAHEGKIPFANTFAIFLTGRGFDQIRQQVALANMNVKICGSSAGITEGPDGATHHSIADVSLMRSLPNMIVIVPADGSQTEAAVRFAHKHKGPVYLRLSRYEIESIFQDPYPYDISKIIEIVQGNDICLVSCGPILKNVLTAAQVLKEMGMCPGVAIVPTIKPLDEKSLSYLALKYRLLVTVEEHSIIGGLASAVSEFVGMIKNRDKAFILPIGIQDTFGESGKPDELLKKHHLDPEGIVACVTETVESAGF